MPTIQEKASSGNRCHIGIYGRMNAGKSSLINAMCNQKISIVSSIPGTTTDVVKKAMEIHDIGPCLFLDTAGFDDESLLKEERIQATAETLKETDIAILLFYSKDTTMEEKFLHRIKNMNIPVIGVLAHSDEFSSEEREERIAKIEKEMGIPTIAVSAESGWGIPVLLHYLAKVANGKYKQHRMTDGLIENGDSVLLVMPQDKEAPVGRLIQPQVMMIRELLDKHCVVTSVATEEVTSALKNMKVYPKAIIVDSQTFHEVYPLVPEGVLLTSFSILMAGIKGDINYYAKSASAIESLTEGSKVLIAECCTHAPIEEDIGRVKIPNLLRKKVGKGLQIDVKAGTDFPSDASSYDLIIQCGGCMFNRRYIMNRINHAKYVNVPMTNYGIAIAYLNGILDHVTIPKGVEE